VLLVAFQVNQVVDYVHRAGDHTEQHESKRSPEQQRPIGQLLIEEQGHKHQAVFDPLRWPQRPE
jgi:hypothetical protein